VTASRSPAGSAGGSAASGAAGASGSRLRFGGMPPRALLQRSRTQIFFFLSKKRSANCCSLPAKYY